MNEQDADKSDALAWQQASLTPPIADRDHIRGTPGAVATLVAYGDYECPYTAAAYPFLIVRPDKPGGKPVDPASVYVLVIAQSAELLEIAMWATAGEVRALGTFEDPGNAGAPAHFLHRDLGHAITTLPITPELGALR